MRAKEYDQFIGMETFTASSPGIGGRLKQHPEDFVVQEIALDGSIAPLEPQTHPYPDQRGKFTAFFMVKRNEDTLQAIRRLSRVVGVSSKRFSFAGIKDRRAVTSQQVSYRGLPQDLVGRHIPGIQILHPHRVPKPIVPGALRGNRFSLTVRGIEVPVAEALRRIEQIHQEIVTVGGVLNFFGPQRFGVVRPTTHLIGRQIVLANYEEAIRILLEGDAADYPSLRSSFEEESTENDARYVEPVQQGTYERAIQHYLNKHPGAYHESLTVLPKDLARLYVHAYQSYLFNRTLSRRVQQGISLRVPTVGDYTMPVQGRISMVRPVTKDTVSQMEKAVLAGKQMLVVPIIGYDFEHVELEGSPGDILTSILIEEAITPGQFRLKALPKLSSRGTFRPVLVTPEEFRTSLDKGGNGPAIQVGFDLAKGSYASVVMREFIKPEYPTQL
ncbi:MAG: tRNA pseudouridine(13) synthase TruD [Candidatus Hodarchaeota archaeon]